MSEEQKKLLHIFKDENFIKDLFSVIRRAKKGLHDFAEKNFIKLFFWKISKKTPVFRKISLKQLFFDLLISKIILAL